MNLPSLCEGRSGWLFTLGMLTEKPWMSGQNIRAYFYLTRLTQLGKGYLKRCNSTWLNFEFHLATFSLHRQVMQPSWLAIKIHFFTRLEKASPLALKMNCPLNVWNLVAWHACKNAIPKWFHEFLTWLIGYVRDSPKQKAEFNLF